jgi:hypothetical protein
MGRGNQLWEGGISEGRRISEGNWVLVRGGGNSVGRGGWVKKEGKVQEMRKIIRKKQRARICSFVQSFHL